MEWLEALRGQVVALDTAPIIYFIEQHPGYLEVVRPFFEAMDSGEFQSVTSAVTLLEVMVHPLRQGNIDLAHRYRDILLNSHRLACVSFSSEIAEEAARLRAEHNLQTPDAIQMATALHEGAASLFTNDIHLPSLPNLRVLLINELAQEK